MPTPKSVRCEGREFTTIKAFAAHYGLPPEKAVRRIAAGWSPEQVAGLAPRRRKGSTGRPVTFGGETYPSLAQAARALGLSPSAVASRVDHGYTREQALAGALRARKGNPKSIEFAGRTYASREELCRTHGERWSNVQRRIARGWTMEQALGIEPAPPRFRDFEGHAREAKWKTARATETGIEPVPDAGGFKLYAVTNTVNAKVYIGITIGALESRLKQHFASARRGRKSAFANAIRKHGEDAFRIELLRADAQSFANLQEQEIEEISRRDSIRNGYNTAVGGSLGTSKVITVNGRRFPSYAQAAEAHGVEPTLFALRIARLKWTPEQAAGLERKHWRGKATALEVNGRRFPSARAAALAHGVKPATMHARMKKGWSAAQAVGLETRPNRSVQVATQREQQQGDS